MYGPTARKLVTEYKADYYYLHTGKLHIGSTKFFCTVEIVEILESRRWSSNARRAGPVIGVLSGGEGKYKVSE